jgi:RimJ/RimL family protein N-acetyltransferase
VLNPDYPIETERLTLRPVGPADVDDLLTYQSREDVCRYIPYEPRTREEVAARIASLRGTVTEEGQALTLGVVVRSSGVLIGDLMLAWRSREHAGGEVGWAFHPDYSGQGYATEAARELLPLAFDGLGLHRIVARVDVLNGPSTRLCERLGMRREAHLIENEWFKGRWSEEYDYGLLAREWRASAG